MKNDRAKYLQDYHKKRKDKLGIKKVSIVFTKDEYDLVYQKSKEYGLSKSVAPYIKKLSLSDSVIVEEKKTDTYFQIEKLQNLKELFRLIKNCTNNINQIAYSLNLDKYYQQNSIIRTKEQELNILKDIYSKISIMENLISKDYYENKL